jgi:hypothetical protein
MKFTYTLESPLPPRGTRMLAKDVPDGMSFYFCATMMSKWSRNGNELINEAGKRHYVRAWFQTSALQKVEIA